MCGGTKGEGGDLVCGGIKGEGGGDLVCVGIKGEGGPRVGLDQLFLFSYLLFYSSILKPFAYYSC